MFMIIVIVWVLWGYVVVFLIWYVFDEDEYVCIFKFVKLEFDDVKEDFEKVREVLNKSNFEDGESEEKKDVEFEEEDEEDEIKVVDEGDDDDDLKEFDMEYYDDEFDGLENGVFVEDFGNSIFGNINFLVYYMDNKDDLYIIFLENGEIDEVDEEEWEEL